MIFAFLSARVRRWVLFAFVLPLVGRLLSTAGDRLVRRNPRAGRALRQMGDLAQRPVTPRPRGFGRRRRR